MRIKSSQGAYHWSRTETIVSNDTVLPSSVEAQRHFWEDAREDEGSVPKWRDKIRSGEGASTYMRAWKSEPPKVVKGYIENKSYHTTYGSPPVDKYLVSGDLCNNPGFGAQVPSDIEAVYNSALVAIHGKIKKAQTEMSGLVFAGELREVLQLIRNPARAIANKTYSYLGDLQKWRKTNRRASKRAYADKLAESWLTYSFGVKPLVSDVEDGARALSRVIHGGIRKRRVSHDWIISDERVTSPLTKIYVMGRNHFPAWQQEMVNTQARVRWICGLRAAADGPDGMSMVNSSFGLALEDFVPAAWNLLPWSFLADYFTNIGDVLESTFTDTSSVVWSLRQTRLETVRRNEAFRDPAETATWFGAQFESSKGSKSSIETKSTEYRRDVIGLDRPSFRLRVNLSSTKVANIAALGTLYRSLLPFGR